MGSGNTIVQLKLFLPAEGSGKASERLIAAAAGALDKSGLTLTPATSGDRAALEGTAPRPRVVFRHPDYPERDDRPDSFVTIAAGNLGKIDTDFVLVGLLFDTSADEGAASWQAGLDIAHILAPALGAGLGLMNGGRADDDRSLFPANCPAVTEQLPAAFTPWTYLGPSKLTPLRRAALKKLPGARTGALGPGWEIQLLQSLTDNPPKDLRKALAAVDEETIAYMGPHV